VSATHTAATGRGGPVAVVTGAATGIGAATAGALADAGYSVALWDIDDSAATTLAADLSTRGRGAIAVPVDVANPHSITAALAETLNALGTPTAVVCAAGVMNVHPFLDLPITAWQQTMAVNLTGTFLVLQACGRAMVEEGRSGAMVAVASIAARGPRADAADYAASKAAVVSVVESAAVALAARGVRVNAICPGVVDTSMTQRNSRQRAEREHTTEQHITSQLVAQVPMGRIAAPGEIAAVIVRLLADEFGYVTGQAINVCGGLEFN
jgi:NAD(P)-dependent dehydrogenase (short-subunit alcohol dehydrogenase family)